MSLIPNSRRVLLNVISAVGFIPFILACLVKNIRLGIKSSVENNERAKPPRAVFLGADHRNIPVKLNHYIVHKATDQYLLNKESLEFLLKKVYLAYVMHPYFCLKITYKVAQYTANWLNYHHPHAFIVTSEYSFASSCLTEYCEAINCMHINVMHGEKLFFVRDSFFSFHQCYVWHEHYKELFISLEADIDQFCVELPPKFQTQLHQPEITRLSNKNRVFKYYLGGETREELDHLAKHLKEVSTKFTILLRPHPLYSDIDETRRIFMGIEMEMPANIDILQSLTECDLVAGLYTTVLFLGLCMGKELVINDLNEEKYERLKELEFICVRSAHYRLSELKQ